MTKRIQVSLRALKLIGMLAFLSLLGGFGIDRLSAKAQLAGIFESPKEREIYNTLPGGAKEGTLLDATNPMELMNRLRRASAMNDATAPADAIDQALQALEDDRGISLD